jgi:branched-chain amino acid transport system permease protein
VEYVIQFYAIYGSVINFIGINALLALSLNVTLSAGMLSLGNAAFAAIGGYTAGILSLYFKLPYPVSLVGGACAAGLVGLIIGLPVLRLRGVFLAMATLAFGEVVRLAAVNLNITGGAEGLTGIPNITNTWIIYLVLAAAAYFVAVLRRSRLGWGLVSMREDETAAGSLGIHITYYKVVAFVIGAMLAGLAGGMYAHLNYLITPRDYGFFVAVDLLTYNIVGGIGVWYGPILGATLLTALPEVLRGIGVTAGPIRMGINGLILLLVILFLPNGLASLFSRKRAQSGKTGTPGRSVVQAGAQ